MMRVGLTEFRVRGHDVVGKVQFGGERVILERQGRPVAALVPLEDLAALEELEDRAAIAAADLAEAEPGENVSLEQVKRELGL